MLTIEELEERFADYEQRINRLAEIKGELIKRNLFYFPLSSIEKKEIRELTKKIKELINKPLQLEKVEELYEEIKQNIEWEELDNIGKAKEYVKLKKYDDAISLAKQELKGGRDIEAALIIAEAEKQKNMPELGIEVLSNVLESKEINEITQEAFYKLALISEEIGDKETAMNIYKRFLAKFIKYKDIEERYKRLKGISVAPVVKRRTAEKKPIETLTSTITSGKGVPIGGKYELLREIGKGGMGLVYEAIDKQLEKKVALKKMKEEIRINPKEKRKFLKEARFVAKLHHPNIVDIYTIVEEDDNIYLVFEYVDGETLRNMLNKEDRIDYKRAIKIIEQICEALEYAHSKKIIHRDLKPSNIMVDPNLYVKVMDFGIAREAKDTISRVTGKRDTSGTLIYMAPEQHLGQYNERTDIFSLGVLIYEMLTGEAPFRGPDFLAQKERMVYKPISEYEIEIPGMFSEIIDRCLQAEIEKRYSSVKEIKEVLKNIE